MDVKKYMYLFGEDSTEGNARMKAILGGKGANLAEMSLIGIPVPPGFTLSTELCALYNRIGKNGVKEILKDEVQRGIAHIEKIMGTKYGDASNPLLLSVRSGARVSMPGMMDTVLNLGLNSKNLSGLISKSGNERFVWDSYRRLIQMYGDVVMGLKAAKEEEDPFEEIIAKMKSKKGVTEDTDLTTDDLKEIVSNYEKAIEKGTGLKFPKDPMEQLWNSIFAVFESWNNDRAFVYRNMHNYPHDWGTAVNVQAMVFGNLGENSATGVAFTRNASTGEDVFNGEYLFNAQGEDVVAGVRTPQEVTLDGSKKWALFSNVSESERKSKYPSLEEAKPSQFAELMEYETRLENHYKDMQDMEFTIQQDKLWILQTRSGKRTGKAMVKIAVDMLEQGVIDEETAIMRVDPEKLEELLHPVFDTEEQNKLTAITKGLPASPGAATGQIVFFADDAEKWAENGKKVILVRIETSPEDIRGMNAAEGILTSRGGMTSHAAIVARGMGKCCVSGTGSLIIDYRHRTMTVDHQVLKEGDWISLNGTTGELYAGKIPTKEPDLDDDFSKLLALADRHARLKVRTNADTPADAKKAREFGAQGIGLTRTEHMFFEGDQIIAMREMILSDTEEERRRALVKILPIQRKDFEGIFEAMSGLPVTIRLLDPPLHEFLPQEEDSQLEMAQTMNVSLETIIEKVQSLKETNPMLGHRGCRLGITYPEITEIQARAIIEAALNVRKKGFSVFPEIMIPLIGRAREFKQQANLIKSIAEKVFSERGERIDFKVGTMIEVPRAALTSDYIAEEADFFSYGTNDLTQMTFGFSRDDFGKFFSTYLKEGILDSDPFKRIDENGVGRLIRFSARHGHRKNPGLKLGICGEHGGNPESIHFFHKAGLNYVSCSPFRVPIARLAAAQAAIMNETHES